MKKVLIMAGGTGGHVFPALVVAQNLQQQGLLVHWLGTQRGLEHEIVPNAKLPISYIAISGMRGKGLKKLILAPFVMVRALLQAIKIIKTVKPDVVLGMGGFVSGPGGLAAWLLRRPLIIHEQNAAPGLTNRLLAYLAKNVLEAFPGTFPKHDHAITTGNPVRTEISHIPSPQQRFAGRNGKIRLLVLGGSQGALVINQVLPNALVILGQDERPEVWHQTGKGRQVDVQQAYHSLRLPARVDAFIHDMAAAYAWADVVLCRAGASTVAELAAVGIASILVPYPYAVDNHQLRNAEYLARVQAAIILPQSEFSPARLAEVLHQLLQDRRTLLAMATAAYNMNFTNAAQKVAEECLRLANINIGSDYQRNA